MTPRECVFEYNHYRWLISNIKFRFSLRQPLSRLNDADLISRSGSEIGAITKRGNITSIRTKKCVFIIFSKQSVNVTGIAHRKNIAPAANFFHHLFPESEREGSIIVDNIMLHGSLFSESQKRANCAALFLPLLRAFCLKHGVALNFNSYAYPGVNLKLCEGSLIVFASGKCNLLGVSSISAFRDRISPLLVELSDNFTGKSDTLLPFLPPFMLKEEEEGGDEESSEDENYDAWFECRPRDFSRLGGSFGPPGGNCSPLL